MFLAHILLSLLFSCVYETSAQSSFIPLNGVDTLEINGYTFAFSDYSNPLSWTDAGLFCNCHGMELATFKDDNEMRQVTEYFFRKNFETDKDKPYYIGGVKIFTDKFKWINGNSVVYDYMAFGQPDNVGTNELCLGMTLDGYFDFDCGTNANVRNFICKG